MTVTIGSIVYGFAQLVHLADPKMSYADRCANKAWKKEYLKQQEQARLYWLEQDYSLNSGELNRLQRSCDQNMVKRDNAEFNDFAKAANEVRSEHAEIMAELANNGVQVTFNVQDSPGEVLKLFIIASNGNSVFYPKNYLGKDIETLQRRHTTHQL